MNKEMHSDSAIDQPNLMQGVDFSAYLSFILFALFFPSFESYLGSTGAIIVNGLIIALLGFYFLALKRGQISLQNSSKSFFWLYALIFVAFFVHILFSMLVGVFFGGISLIFRDIFELHRPLLYFLCFALGYAAFGSRHQVSNFDSLLSWIFGLLVIFGLLQFFKLLEPVSALYTKQSNINSFRVATPFTNPYDYAFVMSFFVFFFFTKVVYRSRWFLFPLFVAFLMLVLPQSRSVVAGFIVGFFVLMPAILYLVGVNFSRLTISKAFARFCLIFTAGLIVLVALLPLMIDNLYYLTYQFVRLIESGQIGNSAGMRLEQFQFALSKASNPIIFIFGNGPAKSEMEFVESIYTYQLYRYGVVGLLFYFAVPLCTAIYLAWKVLRSIDRRSEQYPLFLAIIAWLVTLPFMLIGNNFTEQVRVSFFYYSLLGVLTASYGVFVNKVESAK